MKPSSNRRLVLLVLVLVAMVVVLAVFSAARKKRGERFVAGEEHVRMEQKYGDTYSL